MKIVRVWMLLVVVTGVTLGGCETGESPRGNDVAPPSRVAVVKPPASPSETAARKPSGHSSPKASMDRLMREIEGKAPLPEESMVAVRPPEDRTQPRAPASGSTGTCPPSWFQRGKSSDFRYGIGESAESRQSAEQAARLDVAKGLEVDISGQDTVQARETADEGFEYSVESTIVERVNLSLTGISITKVGTCGHQWYARAALDQVKAATAWREDLRRLGDEAKALSRHVSAHAQNKAAFKRLLAQYRLAVVLETASEIERRLPYLTGKSESTPLRAGAAQDAMNDYETLRDSLKMKPRSGDNQHAVDQATLPKPFVVHVLAGEAPVAGVPVVFEVKKGTIKVSSREHTDGDGKVEVKGYYNLPLNDKEEVEAEIEAKVPLHEITKDYPDALKQQVESRQESLTVLFSVKPPVFHLRQEALGMVGKAKKLESEIQDHETQGNIRGVMKAMAELYKLQKKGKPVVERLVRLHPDSGKDVDALGAPKKTRHALESVLRSLKVKKVSGDDQQAVEQAALPDPFVVRVLAGKDPVAGVPVAFTVQKEQKGTFTVSSPEKKTNKKGKIEAKGSYPTPLENDGAVQIEAKVLLREITKNYPDALKQVVKPYQQYLTKTFSVKPPVFHLIEKVRPMVEKAEGRDKAIKEHKKNKKVLDVMKAMAELYEVQKKGKSLYKNLQERHPSSAKKVRILADSDTTFTKLKDLVSSFRFKDVKGDNQQAKFDSQLNKDLSAKLEAKLGEEYVPARDVPVRFEFEEGTVDVDDQPKTDEDGYVHATVKRVEPGNLEHRRTSIFAKFDSRELGFITDLKENNLHFETEQKFTITRPHACKSGDPFRAPLYDLACDLAGQVNQSKGKLTIVRDFVIKIKSTLSDCHPLSNHIEEALRVGLKLTEQVKVQEPPSGAEVTQKCGAKSTKQVKVQEPSTSENALTPRDPEVEVSGHYRVDPQGKNLLVNATLHRLTKKGRGELEAESGKLIPLDDLPEKVDVPSSNDGLPVVPDPSRLTHEEWVETFWTHRNQEFSTEVQPGKKFYKEGEYATYSFRTDKECYLWVFIIDVEGKVVMLLPNGYVKKPPLIPKKKWFKFPDPKKFRIKITPPLGAERVKTVCTTRSIDIVDSGDISTLNKEKPMFTFSRDNQLFRLVRVASPNGVPFDSGEWSEAHTKITTLPKGQTMTRGMRGLRDLGLVSTEE